MYKITTPWGVVFYAVLVFVFIGFLQRKGAFWAELPGQVGSHFSNFAISYLIVAGPGLMNLVLGTSFLAVWLIATGMIAANLLAECADGYQHKRSVGCSIWYSRNAASIRFAATYPPLWP